MGNSIIPLMLLDGFCLSLTTWPYSVRIGDLVYRPASVVTVFSGFKHQAFPRAAVSGRLVLLSLYYFQFSLTHLWVLLFLDDWSCGALAWIISTPLSNLLRRIAYIERGCIGKFHILCWINGCHCQDHEKIFSILLWRIVICWFWNIFSLIQLQDTIGPDAM